MDHIVVEMAHVHLEHFNLTSTWHTFNVEPDHFKRWMSGTPKAIRRIVAGAVIMSTVALHPGAL
jgi:hypothetical protein